MYEVAFFLLMKSPKLLKILGLGLVYAGAAIGVSHLIQSTRAGASFGFSLILVIVLANILKYPFFRFGSKYAIITGKNLIYAYRQIGFWAFWLFVLFTLATMFTIQAAVTIVTAGIFKYIFDISIENWIVVAGILGFSMLILSIGKYRLLDILMKLIIVVLSITTIVSVVLAFQDFSGFQSEAQFSWDNPKHVFFVIALVGWMPAPLDIAIWQSIWTLEKQKDAMFEISPKQNILDFNIGYWGTTLLAIFFVALGALVLHGRGIELENSAVGFSSQLIEMYTKILGTWSKPLIAITALTTMFSTTLTCLDAFPRVLRSIFQEVKQADLSQGLNQSLYWLFISIVSIGSVVLIFAFVKNMTSLVDFATTLSFLVAPFFAIFNYLAIHSKAIPREYRPKILPKVSVITVCYNVEKVLESTIKSVISQTYPNLEYVVVDGKSKDGTLEIVRKYDKNITKWISEPDKSLYDAMNKAIDLASGDFLWFVNAGDEIYSPETLEKIMQNFGNEDFIYGKVLVFDQFGKEHSFHKTLPKESKLSWKSLLHGMVISHQAMLVRKEITEKYDLNYKVAADIDWTIRTLKKCKKVRYVDIPFAKFENAGISAQNRKTAVRERFKISVNHFGLFPTLFATGQMFFRHLWHLLFPRKNFVNRN